MASFTFEVGAEVDILSGDEFKKGMHSLESSLTCKPNRRIVFSDGQNVAYTAVDNAPGFILKSSSRPASGRIWSVRSVLVYDPASPSIADNGIGYLCVGSAATPSLADARYVLGTTAGFMDSQTFTSDSIIVNHGQDLYVIALKAGIQSTAAFNCEVADYPESAIIGMRL